MTFVLDPHFFSLAWLKFLSRVIHCISDWISLVVGLIKSWPELAFPSHRFPSALIHGSSAWAPGNNQGAVGGGGLFLHFRLPPTPFFLPMTPPSSSRPAWNLLSNFKKLLGLLSLSPPLGAARTEPVHIFWSWDGQQEPWVLTAGRFLLPCGGGPVLFRESLVGLSLSARFRGFCFFFYCLCQLAAQGYRQLSVRALIFVSYGQVLLVICYLFSFVQPELYLSTN